MTQEQLEADSEIVHADVAVIGAGPAGIAAAACAAECGSHVLVLDRGANAGGQIWRHRSAGEVPRPARPWLARLARSGARMIDGVSVVHVRRLTQLDGFEILAESRGRALHLHAARIVLATGARELFLPFEKWTLPGVVGVGGAQALLKSGAEFRGMRVVVAGSGPLLLPVAASLARSGARVSLVAEQASGASVRRFGAGLWRSPSLLAQAAVYRARFLSAPYRTGTWVTAAHGAARLDGVTVTDGRRTWREAADMLCTGYGLIPNIELARLLGCETSHGAVVVDARQATTVPGAYAAGEATGVGGAPLSLVEGELAGMAAAGKSSSSTILDRRRAELRRAADRMRTAFALRPELRTMATRDTIVCRCEDVTLGALGHALCAREAKLHTRAGMGPCQGRICAPALEFLFGWNADSIRSPVEPTRVSVLASDVAGSATPSD